MPEELCQAVHPTSAAVQVATLGQPETNVQQLLAAGRSLVSPAPQRLCKARCETTAAVQPVLDLGAAQLVRSGCKHLVHKDTHTLQQPVAAMSIPQPSWAAQRNCCIYCGESDVSDEAFAARTFVLCAGCDDVGVHIQCAMLCNPAQVPEPAAGAGLREGRAGAKKRWTVRRSLHPFWRKLGAAVMCVALPADLGIVCRYPRLRLLAPQDCMQVGVGLCCLQILGSICS